mmetsp:Transcript_29929/g.65298  ORF Transcript_29929/g.65298 Transcript_29929/m.65298 type:complete len:288 (+) Transcript_29929:464-1327(+)
MTSVGCSQDLRAELIQNARGQRRPIRTRLQSLALAGGSALSTLRTLDLTRGEVPALEVNDCRSSLSLEVHRHPCQGVPHLDKDALGPRTSLLQRSGRALLRVVDRSQFSLHLAFRRTQLRCHLIKEPKTFPCSLLLRGGELLTCLRQRRYVRSEQMLSVMKANDSRVVSCEDLGLHQGLSRCSLYCTEFVHKTLLLHGVLGTAARRQGNCGRYGEIPLHRPQLILDLSYGGPGLRDLFFQLLLECLGLRDPCLHARSRSQEGLMKPPLGLKQISICIAAVALSLLLC